MFFLFFGTRLKRSVLGSGTFHCPYCYAQRQYEQLESRTWFHVFWIPLVPLGSPQESVRCTVCGGEWSPQVLHTPAGPQDARPRYDTPQDDVPQHGSPQHGSPQAGFPQHGTPQAGGPWGDNPPTDSPDRRPYA